MDSKTDRDYILPYNPFQGGQEQNQLQVGYEPHAHGVNSVSSGLQRNDSLQSPSANIDPDTTLRITESSYSAVEDRPRGEGVRNNSSNF